MKYPLGTYQAFGDKCADAHYGKDTQRATDLFAVLWSCLAEETASDHGQARVTFNEAFRLAYLSRWRPAAAQASFEAQNLKAMLEPLPCEKRQRTLDKAGLRPSVALDCAAFFAKHGA